MTSTFLLFLICDRILVFLLEMILLSLLKKKMYRQSHIFIFIVNSYNLKKKKRPSHLKENLSPGK